MPALAFLMSVPAPALPADWAGVAVRPGSGLGLLPAALSVQPGATLLTLVLAGVAAAALRRPARHGAPAA
jgi:hypothetical protein